MRVSRFFTSQQLSANQSITLDKETSHYLFKVLRLGSGDPLVLFNGDGRNYHAVIDSRLEKLAIVRVTNSITSKTESRLRIELGQGISRGERMDFVLQKSVELGVNSVTPLWTQRSQVKLHGQRLERRLTHWRGIIRSACEQSGRAVLPVLDEPAPFSAWCAVSRQHLRIVLDPGAAISLGDLPDTDRVTLLVGPEGGLENDEIRAAETHGFHRVHLGPRVLRTETAALTALSAAQTLWGDIAP